MILRRFIRHFACVIAAASFFASADAFAEKIAQLNLEGLDIIEEAGVRNIIEIEAGDEYSPSDIEETKQTLLSWGVFESVNVHREQTPDGIILTFNFAEQPVVAAIDVDGNYPYVENKIRKNLTLHPGDPFNDAKIEEQIERIEAFYAREGFVGTHVYVDRENMPEWGGVILSFHIRHGAELRVRSIEVTGNKSFPKGRFVTAINPYRQYSDRRLFDSIRKLRELYAWHGYPKAKVKVAKKQIDPETHRVDIGIEVNEGPHVKLIFKGSPHLSRRHLRKTVTVLREGSIDSYEIEKSADAIRDLIRERGYPDVKIGTKKYELPDKTIVIEFDIDEGKEQRIRYLNFSGNEDVSSKKLKRRMRNREQAFGRHGAYSPEFVAEDDSSIQRALSTQGYLDAKVGDWDIKSTKQGFALDVTIPIEEGPQVFVKEVSFHGNHGFDTTKLLRQLKVRPGKPINLPALADDRERLITFYSDNGYPYVEIAQSLKRDELAETASVTYDISEGEFVHIGSILFVGDVMTSQKAIRGAMDIHEGDAFSYKKIVDSQLNIRRLGPFAAVSIEPLGLDEKKTKIPLKVKVEEQRPFMLDLGFAYSTAESFTGNMVFTNLNAFGWAKSNTLKLIGGRLLSRAELGWYDPRFLGSSFEMTTNAWVQYKKRPSYAFAQLGGSFGWMRRLRRLGFAFRYEMDRNHFIQGDSVAANADSLSNNTISRISLSASYDSRDSFSDPKKGFYTLGSTDIFNEIKGNEANFFKFSWQGENDLSFLSRFVLSTALRFDRIQTVGNNVAVPTNELYFMGGDYTIRGYAEDSLGPKDANGKAVGAKTRWIVNEELRLRLWRALSWVTFFDMGSLTNSFSDIGSNSIRKSIGFGLRYMTPVGPIRAEYGFKLLRRSNESIGRFHITFGYVF